MLSCLRITLYICVILAAASVITVIRSICSVSQPESGTVCGALPEGYSVNLYPSNSVRITPHYVHNISMEEELARHPKWFVRCPKRQNYLDYCQQHYLMSWDPKSGNFSDYKPQMIVSGDDYDVTYCIHTSIRRIDRLPLIMKRWKGPISLALYSLWSDLDQVNQFLNQVVYPQLTVILYIVDDREPINQNDNCVYKRMKGSLKISCIKLNERLYPINYLRNLAIDSIQTTHMVTADIDLIPSLGLYEELKNLNFTEEKNRTIAYVISAFQFTRQILTNCSDQCFRFWQQRIPYTKIELEECVKQKNCQVMNAHLQTYKTVSQSWYHAKEPLEKWGCIPFDGMEPYTMIRRTNTSPRYNKRFINYGFNKIQYINELRAKGYYFYSVNRGFGFDTPHKPSNWADEYNESFRKTGSIINGDVYMYFLTLLKRQIGNYKQPVCPKELAVEYFSGKYPPR